MSTLKRITPKQINDFLESYETIALIAGEKTHHKTRDTSLISSIPTNDDILVQIYQSEYELKS